METQGNKRGKNKIFSFFKSREANLDIPYSIDQPPSKAQRVEIDVSSLERIRQFY